MLQNNVVFLLEYSYNWRWEEGVFILTAKTAEGELIVLSADLKKEQLKEWRKKQRFYCPQCRDPVHLKVGDIIIPHFAHQQDASCRTSFAEGESKVHLQGKQQLYAFFRKHADYVELEPYLPLLAQRPDLLVTKCSEVIPIEFQCSTIPIADIAARTAGYRRAGMRPTWILRTPAKFSALPQGVGIFHFSKFHESFFHHTPVGFDFLTYNPETTHFHYFSNLMHLAGKRYIGIHRSLPVALQIFPFARPRTPTVDELQGYATFYLSARATFLQSRILLNRRGINDPFLRACYDLRVLPMQLPLWIGVPVRYGEAFREHDCEWQLLLLRYMKSKDIAIRDWSTDAVRGFVSRFAGSADLQVKACMGYRNFLLSLGIESLRTSVDFNEETFGQLLAERFLAKRYEN
ncbi:competence protein CoiA family protein [Sporosarcina sp. FSL K6-1522]|uniref:competence protein CoiA n=1 Tax=Sporosarcina sp. FSL K6-1522 TaxID=2921554 RepID=UPI00315ABBD2